MSQDFSSTQTFRSRTLKFVRQSLGFDDSQDSSSSQESNPTIISFEPVGKAITAVYTPVQINRLLEQIEFFLEMQALEHRISLSNDLPSVEQYRKRRMGTSAVGVCLAISEYAYSLSLKHGDVEYEGLTRLPRYCYDVQLPEAVMKSEAMTRLWDKTNVIISTVNDILSVNKEVALGQVDSLIPLAYAYSQSTQVATDLSVHMIETAVTGFEEAVESLIASYTENDASHGDLDKFVDSCRYACTANLNWSLKSERYGLAKQKEN
ncbi:MAG: hypothetical protein Q9167_003472, partial [Letrouitia subvulpina]